MSSADPQRNDLEQDASSASAPANCSAAEISELEAKLEAKQKDYVRAWRRISHLQEEIMRLKADRSIDFDETATFLIDSANNRLTAAKILLAEKHGEPPNDKLTP